MTNPLPSLSELLSWSTTHLTAGANYWDGLADRWKGAFGEIHQRIRACGWEGQAYDATDERTYWDSVLVGNAADDLHDGAKTARHAASDVTAAQDRLREAVTKARDAGFEVGDDYTVTSRETVGTPVQQGQRQAQAESLAEDIRWRATALVDTDQHAGTRVTDAVGHLGNLTFEELDGSGTPATEGQERNGAQLVSFFGPKESPIPEPGVPDDPVGRGARTFAACSRSCRRATARGLGKSARRRICKGSGSGWSRTELKTPAVTATLLEGYGWIFPTAVVSANVPRRAQPRLLRWTSI
jgi:hypothetical protein